MLVEKYPEGSNRKRQDNDELLQEIASLRAKVKELEDVAKFLASAVRPDPEPDTRNDKNIEYGSMFQ